MPFCRACHGTGQVDGETESGVGPVVCHRCEGRGWVAAWSFARRRLIGRLSKFLAGIVTTLLILGLLLCVWGFIDAQLRSRPLPIDGVWESSADGIQHRITIASGRVFRHADGRIVVSRIRPDSPTQYTGRADLRFAGDLVSRITVTVEVLSDTEIRITFHAIPEKGFPGESANYVRLNAGQ